MKTTKGDCGCKDKPGKTGEATSAVPVSCQPCELPPFCRNHYYKGKLLTARDFADEQTYHASKLRNHHLQVHGWGVVCGFKVTPHPYCPALRVVVSAGFAIDACGREVRMADPVEIALPLPDAKQPSNGCEDPKEPGHPEQRMPPPAEPGHNPTQTSPYTHSQPDDSHFGMHEMEGPNVSAQKASRASGDAPYARQGGGGQEHPTYGAGERGREQEGGEQEGGEQGSGRCDGPEPIDLYLCVRYVECESERSKVIFDDCGCPPQTTQPNRICEGAELVLYTTKPSWWDDALPKGCEHADCKEIFCEALEGCVCPPPIMCLPLAVIQGVVAGEPVSREQIDNSSSRRRLVSTELLDRAIHCILDKLPTKDLTKIIDINWNHSDSYTCHEFMADFVIGNAARGFRIQFDSKVYSEAIDIQSFQAVVVFRPADRSRPHTLEVAPVKIEWDPDETDWCRLRIDPTYAKRALDEADFDVFLTLRCNVITGKNGYAVDGNFLAQNPADGPYRMEFPTGDNTPGGTFESWFSVRRAGKSL